jgi:DNA invertase Pin-like site-specific DNA recombinase
MTKIAPDHLGRQAFVYVRQSTQDQLLHNHESRRRQYALADRARQLGWAEPAVIDDDLGRSGGGVARPGFERLLLAICEGRAGIVLAVEASRLARNGRDWHTLLEFCGLVGCLLADEDGIYDPRLPNDRLLLGMKGTMSEMELSILRQRSLEALRQKARRGELFLNVAVGYVKVRHDRIAKDPDQRVREAVGLVFRKFAEFQSIRQVHLWLRQEQVLLPSVETVEAGRRIIWKLPVYNTVRGLLTNPVYGGAYAFGRTASRITVENGRKRISRGHRRDREEWDVLIVDHHEGYISWAEFERNQRLIADNANCRGLMVRGAVRRGDAHLAGLLRCGHCGRRLHVSYSGTDGITAAAPTSITGRGPASPSAVCGSMPRCRPRFSGFSARSAWRPRSRRSRCGKTSMPRRDGRRSSPSPRRVTRRTWRVASMTRSIRRTASSPPSSSGAGTIGSRKSSARRSGSPR